MRNHSWLRILVIAVIVLVMVLPVAPPLLAATSGYSSAAYLPGRYYVQSDAKALLKISGDSSGLPMHTVDWLGPSGASTSCNPGGSCATTYDYAPNGVVIGSTWEFYIAEKGRPTGTYTAIIKLCTSIISGICVNWAEVARPTFILSPDPELPVIATIPVGQEARALAVNPLTHFVYVANNDDTVSVIDGTTNTVVKTLSLPSGASPMGAGANPTTNRIYVANNSLGTLSVIDGASQTVVDTLALPEGTYPMGIGVNPVTNRIYVTGAQGNGVLVLDGSTHALVTTVTVDNTSYLWDIAVNPVTNRIYVANYGGSNVGIIDGNSHTVIDTVTVAPKPRGISANPTTNRVYVASGDETTVSVIDGASNTVAATVAAGAAPSLMDIAVNPTTNHVFAGDSQLTVAMLSGANHSFLDEIPLGRPVREIVVDPTLNHVYVANLDGNTVTVIQDEGASAPQVSVSASVSPAAAHPGDRVIYTVNFANTGAITATGVLITDTLPAALVDTGYTSSGVPLTPVPGSRYAWQAPDLGPDEGGTITITAALAKPLAAGPLTNTVTLAVSGTVATASAIVSVQNVAPSADAGPDQVSNHGGTVALDGTGSADDNGDALTYHWTQTGGPPVTFAPDLATTTFTAPATSGVLTFTLGVTDTGGLADHDTVVVTVTQLADLAVSLGGVRAPSGMTYTAVARNLGPSAADGATLSGAFPAGLTSVTWTCTVSGGAVCGSGGSGAAFADTLVSFPAGSTATYTIVGELDGTIAPETTVALAPPAGTTDPVLANNEARHRMYPCFLPVANRAAP